MQTDLPEPVEPAISKCGILDKSASIGLPIISLPKAMFNLPSPLVKSISLILTALTDEFGISIPIVFLPGIGAWILTSLAAIARAISLLMLVIRFTLVPLGTIISYSVTAGPIWISTTFPLISKSFKTLSNISWLLLTNDSSPLFFFLGVGFNKSNLGRRYIEVSICSSLTSASKDSLVGLIGSAFIVLSSSMLVITIFFSSFSGIWIFSLFVSFIPTSSSPSTTYSLCVFSSFSLLNISLNLLKISDIVILNIKIIENIPVITKTIIVPFKLKQVFKRPAKNAPIIPPPITIELSPEAKGRPVVLTVAILSI